MEQFLPQPVYAQDPMIGIDMTQQDYNNLQKQGLANIQPDQQLINQSLAQRAQPQVVDVAPQTQQPIVGNAGAQKTGIDWGAALQGFGNYLAAAGQGINPNATTMGAGLSGAGDTVIKHQQNIRNFQTMSPYYKQMGYDVSKLNPSRGGAGIATTPNEMIDLQSKIAERNYLNDYRQTMAEARLAQQQQKQQSNPTIGDLMLYNPQFKSMMNAQYDFSNGQNADVLSRPMPKEVLQSLMPKNVNMRYSGGLKSSKTSNATIRHTGRTSGGSGKSSSGSSSKKLIF